MSKEDYGKIKISYHSEDGKSIEMSDSSDIDFNTFLDFTTRFALALGYQQGSIDDVLEAWVEDLQIQRKSSKEN